LVGSWSLLQLSAEGPVGRLDGTLIEVAFNVRRQAPRVKIQKVGRNVQNLSELLVHRVLRRVATVMFQIVQPRRQNPPTIRSAEALGNRLLGQARRFACIYDHLSECLHLPGPLQLSLPQNHPVFALEFNRFELSCCPTGPGPVFRDYQGLFGPFWDRPYLPKNR